MITTKVDKLITASRKAFLLLEEYVQEYDEDDPPAAMVEVLNLLSNALGAIGAHPHAETDRRPTDNEIEKEG